MATEIIPDPSVTSKAQESPDGDKKKLNKRESQISV